ncbi:MAG: 5'/3'-nucleotidase SurE [Ignavibacteriaceae bacterium]|nr:5'/3'-nucleotidase SurE [Ignavibacteriaceae bacterium]
MKVLVSNDDGIDAAGIIALVEELEKFAEVFVIAPLMEQSAAGHSITIKRPLKIIDFHRNNKFFGYAVDGTPADCVKIGITTILKFKPDIVLSGINHGSNTATNVIYSGTVSAAREALLMGISGIAFSLDSRTSENIKDAAKIAASITRTTLLKGLNKGTFLNVNIPDLPIDEIKGIKVTRQGKAKWADSYIKKYDVIGREFYQLTGEFNQFDENDDDSDHLALTTGWVAVTPVKLDITDYEELESIKNWEFNF